MGSSSTSYHQVGASDEAVGVSGSTNATVARDQGVALGSGATLSVRSGGTNLGNIGSGANVTVGETGLGQTFADTIKSVTESNTAALSAIVQNATRTALPNAQDLPAGDVTAGAKDTKPKEMNWLLWGGIAAGLAAVWFFFLRE